MSEKRADQLDAGRGNVVSQHAYEAPMAEWHDLRVITLGGVSGTGDSGAEGVQVLPGSTHYDESDTDYDNYA